MASIETSRNLAFLLSFMPCLIPFYRKKIEITIYLNYVKKEIDKNSFMLYDNKRRQAKRRGVEQFGSSSGS